MDPNKIPVSPSGSALQRLSYYEPAPSMTPSESRSAQSTPPHPPSEPVPPIDEIPDIPDINSKSSKNIVAQPKKPLQKSKLSMLANSRASGVLTRSQSSRSSATGSTLGVKTYPDLRPSAESMRPPSSSVGSTVRRAVQTALDLEAKDRAATPRATQTQLPSDSPSTTPVPTVTNLELPPPPEVPSPPKSLPAVRPPSKLASLAQAKVEAWKGARIPKPKSNIVIAPRGRPILEPEHTEYLTPIANGSSVTTAITTSYQTIYTLTDPTRPPELGPQYVAPLVLPSPANEPRKSKLAMKSRKAHEKPEPKPAAIEEAPPVTPPMFLAKATRTRASPSAFASLLVDESLTSHGSKDKDKGKGKGKERDPGSPVSDEDKHKSHDHTHSRSSKSRIPQTFAFDSPSPDDIVLNARRGTSLAQHRTSSSISSATRSPALAGKSSSLRA